MPGDRRQPQVRVGDGSRETDSRYPGRLTGLEQARDDGQCNKRPDETRYRPPAGIRLPRDRVRQHQRAEGHDRINEVEGIAGATAAGEEPKTACHGHDEYEDDDLFKALG
jgi:hypothetical protein